MSKHTPTPWFLNDSDIPPTIYAVSQEDPTHQPCIAVFDADKPYIFDGVAVQEANAEFIVRACNNHAELQRMAELVLSSALHRRDQDWKLMHLDLSEAAEIAGRLVAAEVQP